MLISAKQQQNVGLETLSNLELPVIWTTVLFFYFFFTAAPSAGRVAAVDLDDWKSDAAAAAQDDRPAGRNPMNSASMKATAGVGERPY